MELGGGEVRLLRRRKVVIITSVAIVVVIASAECIMMLTKEGGRLLSISTNMSTITGSQLKLIPSSLQSQSPIPTPFSLSAESEFETSATDTSIPVSSETPTTPTAATITTTTTIRSEMKGKTVLLADCSTPYSADCCLKPPLDSDDDQDTIRSSSGSWSCPNTVVPSKSNITSARKYNTLTLTETFQYIQAGGSIARFGDGEIKAIWGNPNNNKKRPNARATWERRTPELSKALKFVASLGGSPQSGPSCLCVGTYPVLDGNFSYFRQGNRRKFAENIYPKYMETWNKIMPMGQYCDSFISRPDGVDKIEYPPFEYFTPQWQQVFADQRVLLVRGGKGPIFLHDNNTNTNNDGTTTNPTDTENVIIGSIPATNDTAVFDRHFKYAKNVEQILSFRSIQTDSTKHNKGENSSSNSSSSIDHENDDDTVVEVSLVDSASDIFPHYVGLRDAVLHHLETGQFDVVVLSLGQAATVLAAELACRGYWALDVGQFGGDVIKSD